MAKQRTLSRGELTAETTPAASNGMKRIIFVPKEIGIRIRIRIGQDSASCHRVRLEPGGATGSFARLGEILGRRSGGGGAECSHHHIPRLA